MEEAGKKDGNVMGKKEKRKHSLADKSIRAIVILGIFMAIGTCAASGVQLFRRNKEVYRDLAYSYCYQASINISGDKVRTYLETGEKDEEYDRIFQYLAAASVFSNLRYFYVVVPTEEDLIYVWDSFAVSAEGKIEEGDPYAFLEHVPYSTGEKEAMRKVMNGEWDDGLLIDLNYNGGEALATALCPLYDSDMNPVAVVGVDISMRGFLTALLRLYLNIFLAIAAILLIGMTIYYKSLRKNVISPVLTMKKATVDIFQNIENQEVLSVDVHTGDEFDDLARSFEEMDRRMKIYIRENAAIVAERQRISTELDLARRIQADMLPNIFPPFPDRKEVEIFASMNPAKEVGGDFYDFFFIDENRLALVIADVSGKGIPAALFMMMSKILLQNYAMSGMRPAEVLETVNDTICKNNREEMFVTVWLGVLDLATGILTAANAGHEYPALKKPGGEFKVKKDVHSFVIGGVPGITYKEYELQLEAGTKLFLYTDGLPEATDSHNELFGTDRMTDTLNHVKDGNPSEIIQELAQHVDRYVGEAPQFDDLTMMCIVYNGGSTL